MQLYEPFPTRAYLASAWLDLDDADDAQVDTSLNHCAQGLRVWAGLGYRVRGLVHIGQDSVSVQLQHGAKTCDTPVDGWCPYPFNGLYPLRRMSGSAQAASRAEAPQLCRSAPADPDQGAAPHARCAQTALAAVQLPCRASH